MLHNFVNQAIQDAEAALAAEEYVSAIRLYSHLILLNIQPITAYSKRAFARFRLLESDWGDKIYPRHDQTMDQNRDEKNAELALVLQDLQQIPLKAQVVEEKILFTLVAICLCENKNDFDNVFKMIEDLLVFAPDNVQLLLIRARCLESYPGNERQNYYAAISQYSEILKLNPNCADAFSRKYFLYGKLYTEGFYFNLEAEFYAEFKALADDACLADLQFALYPLFTMWGLSRVDKFAAVLYEHFSKQQDYMMMLFISKLHFIKTRNDEILEKSNGLFNSWLDKILELKKADHFSFLKELNHFESIFTRWKNDFGINPYVEKKHLEIDAAAERERLINSIEAAINNAQNKIAAEMINLIDHDKRWLIKLDKIAIMGDQYKKIDRILMSSWDERNPKWLENYIHIKNILNDVEVLSDLEEEFKHNPDLFLNIQVKIEMGKYFLSNSKFKELIAFFYHAKEEISENVEVRIMIAVANIKLGQDEILYYKNLNLILHSKNFLPYNLMQIARHLIDTPWADLANKAFRALQCYVDRFQLSSEDITQAIDLFKLFTEKNNLNHRQALLMFADKKIGIDVEITNSASPSQ